MDLQTASFEDFLFHARYGIIGAAIIIVFVGAMMTEAFKELRANLAQRRSPTRSVAFGPLTHDDLLGHVMTDGGEPMETATSSETRNE